MTDPLPVHNGAKESLLTGLLDPEENPNSKRRYRRCKSTPAFDGFSPENYVRSLFPNSGLRFSKFHPSLKQVIVFLAIYLGVGTLCFFSVRSQITGKKTNGILDAVYFCIVTMTTVGYGDLVPDSALSKLMACVFVFTGMALVGLILSSAADYLVDKQEMLLVKALHMRRKTRATEISKEIENHRAKYKLLAVATLLLVLVVMGTIFLYKVEDLDMVDAFYCVCSTITTLGYGDKSFSTEGGRIFAIFWILISTICVAQFFLYLTEFNTEHRQHLLAKWVLTRRMTFLDLEAADLDNDGVVSAAEFIIYKLKEMGKISQEDIAAVMEEFDDLDVDQSGTLSASDLALAQPSQGI